MPLIESTFHPARAVRNPHIQTVLGRFVGSSRSSSVRHRIELSDGDFLDCFLHENGLTRRLAIVTHGLEGSVDSPYVRVTVQTLLEHGWRVLTWNMRGCGGVPNRLLACYHSGKSEDLDAVVAFATTSLNPSEIALIGFSVGGNIALRFIATHNLIRYPRITGACAVSSPIFLEGSARRLANPHYRLYMEYFLRSLRRKIRDKSKRFPGIVDLRRLDSIQTFEEFDARFTAPLHGFSSAYHYWEVASAGPHLNTISIPTLLLSSRDDPFLSPTCFPDDVCRSHPLLFGEFPAHGGHVGFIGAPWRPWYPTRIAEFFESITK